MQQGLALGVEIRETRIDVIGGDQKLRKKVVVQGSYRGPNKIED
jgi:hypothetical protein